MTMEYKNFLDIKGNEKDIGSIIKLITEERAGDYHINFKRLIKKYPLKYEFVHVPCPVFIKKTHNKYMYEKKLVISDREASLNKYKVPDLYSWLESPDTRQCFCYDLKFSDRDSLSFITRYGWPLPAILKLSDMYPNVEILYEIQEQDMPFDTTVYIIKKGEIKDYSEACFTHS